MTTLSAPPSCPHCQASGHRPGASFCFDCGHPLASAQSACAACGTPMERDDLFCSLCGCAAPETPAGSHEPDGPQPAAPSNTLAAWRQRAAARLRTGALAAVLMVLAAAAGLGLARWYSARDAAVPAAQPAAAAAPVHGAPSPPVDGGQAGPGTAKPGTQPPQTRQPPAAGRPLARPPSSPDGLAEGEALIDEAPLGNRGADSSATPARASPRPGAPAAGDADAPAATARQSRAAPPPPGSLDEIRRQKQELLRELHGS